MSNHNALINCDALKQDNTKPAMERLKKNLSKHKSEAKSFIGFPKALPISLTINTNQY